MEDDELDFDRKKLGRDPMSHRIIEKRRRDRMNNCLADLSHLIPSTYLKKGRGRIEKTEIVEMAIKHIRHLQQMTSSNGSEESDKSGNNWQCPKEQEALKQGYNECIGEAVHFLVNQEGFCSGDPLCLRLVGHLRKHLGNRGSRETNNDSDYSSLRSESSAGSEQQSSNEQSRTGMSSSTGSLIDTPCSTSSSLVEMSVQQQQEEPFNRPSDRTSSSSTSQLKRSISTSDECSVVGQFKFKANMRDRFCNEFESQCGQDEEEYEEKESSSDYYVNKRRCTANATFSKPNQPTVESNSNNTKNSDCSSGAKSVPIFALHPRGSHYIPLSVENAVIAPYLSLFELDSEAALMLHPITISVNFCGPIQLAAAAVHQPTNQHPQNLVKLEKGSEDSKQFGSTIPPPPY